MGAVVVSHKIGLGCALLLFSFVFFRLRTLFKDSFRVALGWAKVAAKQYPVLWPVAAAAVVACTVRVMHTLVPDHDGDGDTDAADLFAAADTDGNGVLSYAEMVSAAATAGGAPLVALFVMAQLVLIVIGLCFYSRARQQVAEKSVVKLQKAQKEHEEAQEQIDEQLRLVEKAKAAAAQNVADAEMRSVGSHDPWRSLCCLPSSAFCF